MTLAPSALETFVTSDHVSQSLCHLHRHTSGACDTCVQASLGASALLIMRNRQHFRPAVWPFHRTLTTSSEPAACQTQRQTIDARVGNTVPFHKCWEPTICRGRTHKGLLLLVAFSIFCMECGDLTTDVHYHCDVCSSSDFDHCPTCFAQGIHCWLPQHRLVKRIVDPGGIIDADWWV